MEFLIAPMRAALEENPKNTYARFELANALASVGRHEEAVRELDHLLAQDPDYEHGAAWYNRGNSLVELGRLEDAVASYAEALARPFDGRSAAAANQALALEQLGRDAEAAAARAQVEVWATEEAQTAMAQGHEHFGAERWAEALAFYEAAARLPWPGAHASLLNGAICLDHLGRGDEALRWVDASLECAPDWPPAVLHKGIFLATQRQFAEALALVNRALELGGPEPLALFNRAEIHARLRQNEEALADLEQALALAPEARQHLDDTDAFAELSADPRFVALKRG